MLLPIAIPAAIKLLPWRMILPAMAVAGALWFAYDWAHDRGRDGERAKWQAVDAKAAAKALAKERAMQAQVDAAGAALSAQTAEIERLAQLAAVKRNNYYVQNPAAAAVVCLSDSRYVHHRRADEAANAALAAK